MLISSAKNGPEEATADRELREQALHMKDKIVVVMLAKPEPWFADGMSLLQGKSKDDLDDFYLKEGGYINVATRAFIDGSVEDRYQFTCLSNDKFAEWSASSRILKTSGNYAWKIWHKEVFGPSHSASKFSFK